jgi:hypothetical protein
MFKQMSDLKCGDLFRVCNERNRFFSCKYSSINQVDLIMSMDDNSCVVAIYMGKVTEDQYQYVRVFVRSGVYLLDSYYFDFNCEVVAHV